MICAGLLDNSTRRITLSPPMKIFLLLLCAGLGLIDHAYGADEKATHTYEGKITGVVCAACKEHITAALTQKLPGVVSVDVKNTDTPEKKLTLVATTPGLTKEAVTTALGTYAKNYQVLSLDEKK